MTFEKAFKFDLQNYHEAAFINVKAKEAFTVEATNDDPSTNTVIRVKDSVFAKDSKFKLENELNGDEDELKKVRNTPFF